MYRLRKRIIYALAIAISLGIYFSLKGNTPLAILAALSGLYFVAEEYIVLHKKMKVYRDREALTVNEIYDRHFSDSGIAKNIFIPLWIDVANTLELPAEKLRPDDRFGVELGPYRQVDDLMDVLEHKLHEQTDSDINAPESLYDYIIIMSNSKRPCQ